MLELNKIDIQKLSINNETTIIQKLLKCGEKAGTITQPNATSDHSAKTAEC